MTKVLVWERGDSSNSFKMAGFFSPSVVLSPKKERAAGGGGARSDWSLCRGFCRAAGKRALLASGWLVSNWRSLSSVSLGMSKDSLLNLREEGEGEGKEGREEEREDEKRVREGETEEGRKGNSQRELQNKRHTREVRGVVLTCCSQLPGASQWR